MLRHRPIVKAFLVGMLVLGACAGIAVIYARGSLPVVDGEVTVRGLVGDVEIARDGFGVPHVYAASERDAYFSLGYLHAQDRLWQLELQRRAGSGRLSEIFGKEALPADRLVRTLGFRRAAAASVTQLEPETGSLLAAYGDGINAYLGEGHTLPPEFLLLGVRPESWTPVDSLVIQKLTAWALTRQFDRELLRVRLIRALGSERARELLSEIPKDLHALDAVLSGLASAAGALQLPGASRHSPAIGSNSWAVAGAKTRSGHPLMANDPHMDLTSPSLWYLAHLEAPSLTVIGATLPGLPGVIIGRNSKLAWGFTNARIDALDFYIEQLTPEGDASVHEQGSERLEVLTEHIEIAGAASEDLQVRVSRHGPIVSDAIEEARLAMPQGYALAVRFAALDVNDRTIRFPLRAAHADDVTSLLEAAHDLHSPPQNLLTADSAGHIAFVAAGRVPVRAPENELRGLLPMPGWLDRYDWRGFLPFAQLPQRIDPASGQIVTANQDLTEPGYPHWIGADWDAPHRADRIGSLLDTGGGHTVDTQVGIQLDVRSEWAASLLPALLPMLSTDRHADARAQLARWRFELDADAFEPLLFAAWLRELGRAVYADELGGELDALWAETPNALPQVLSDATALAHWCDDRTTQEREPCSAIVQRAFDRAVTQVGDGSRRWGDVHRARFAHTPFGEVPGLHYVFDVEVASSGGGETVNLGEYTVESDERTFEGRAGPGYRAIYELADLEQSRFMVAPGQSGNVFSKHYRDLADRWAAGSYIPMKTGRAFVEANTVAKLVLRTSTVK